MCRNSIADWLIDPQRAVMNKEKTQKVATAIFVGKPWTCVADCWRNLLIPVVNLPALIFDLWRARAWVNSKVSHQRRQQQQDIEFDPHFHSILFRIRGDFLMHSERLASLGYVWRATTGVDTYQSDSTPKRSVYKIPRNYFSVSRGFLASNRKQ